MKWIGGNLYEHLHAPEMANVGILNLDEYGEIGSRSAETDFPLIHGLVRRGLTRFGEFALFWNRLRIGGKITNRGHLVSPWNELNYFS